MAIKVPAEHLIRGPPGRGVRREARAAASLDHPAVCRVFELGETENRPFIVMEYVQGETLAARLRRGRAPLDRALTWATAVAGAVEQARDQDLAHGDLKPANVMLTRSDRVKVMDFGLARSMSTVRRSEDSGDETSGVGTGRMVSTASYMAPERLTGESADGPSDIWAFGCVLYEILTGQPAFDGDTVPETIAAILEREADWRPLPLREPDQARPAGAGAPDAAA